MKPTQWTCRYDVTLLLAALVPRLVLALLAPSNAGDTDIYSRVAENILANFCVSLSDPATSLCEPHWGGNQLPGFPAFMALVWALSNSSTAALLVGQCVLVSFSIWYLGRTLWRYLGNANGAMAAVLLVTLSPLTMPWTRFVLTEAMTLAATIWLLAELVRSLEDRRLRLFPIALAYTLALFVRYDSVFLAIPVAIVAFEIHGFWHGIRAGMVVAIITAVPLAGWWLRSFIHGLPPTPSVVVMFDGASTPQGYLSWGNDWMVHQYQYPGWNYPMYSRRYGSIRIDKNAYEIKGEKERVERLLQVLRYYEGMPFPPLVDEEFALIVAEKRAVRPLKEKMLRPLKRAAWTWFNPYNSSGWPVSLNLSNTDVGNAAARLWALALQNPLATMVKGGTALYRIGLLILAFMLLCVPAVREDRLARVLLWVALSYAVVRTGFFVSLVLVESRYLVGNYPFLEAAIAVAVLRWFNRYSAVATPR